MAEPYASKRRSRAAFPLCFLSGLLLMLSVILGAVVWSASRTDLFRNGLNRCVVAAGILSQSDAGAFAEETIGYLNGQRKVWAPAVTVDGDLLAVPESFTEHMAAVRGWVVFLRSALPLAAAAGLLLLLLCVGWGNRNGRRSAFSPVGYDTGAVLPVALALGAGLWAGVDFNGFWAWLHATFIPGGIFSAGEPVMRLFPQALFAGYIAPVGAAFAVGVVVVLLLPAGTRLLYRKIKKKAAR